MSDRERQIDELFDRVLDAAPEGREPLLASAGELRRDVESLLDAHEAMGEGFLAVPAGDLMQAKPLESGHRIGRYTVGRMIASGGAGIVYEAEQDQPHRTVALKVMHAGLDSERAQRRFAEEAEILGRLEHPGIAHVYEAGVHEGVPYIAMELLAEVRTLTEHAAGLDRGHKLELFADVCEAVHHGHQQGIIHRDLKPANVLVKSGRPRIVDFGIARAMGRDDDEIAGTVPYMSPEQCTVGAHLDVRSDVYSLGVMLFETLRGTLPYEVTTSSITDAARVIRESAPKPLGISADLDAIVGKALAKSAEGRYSSAAALGEDIRRYLAREPVVARRAGPLHLLKLYIRRRPALSAALAALLVVLVAGVVVSVRFALRAERGRERAEQESYHATVVAAGAALRIHDVEGARTQLALSPVHLRNWEWHYLMARSDRSARTIVWPDMMIYTGGVSAAADYAIATASGGARIWRIGTGEVVCDVPRSGPLQCSCALSPDGERFLVGNDAGKIQIRETATGALIAEVAEGAQIWCLAFSPDGEQFAAGTRGGTLSIRSRDGLPIRRFAGREGTVTSVVYFPDGRRIAAGGEDREIRILDLERGAEILRLSGHGGNVESMALSPGGDRLISGSFDGSVRIWDVDGGECLRTLSSHSKGVKAVAYAPDGGSFASGALDHTVRLWRPDGEEVGALVGHSTMIRGLGYSADSKRIVSFGRGDTVKVWDLERQAFGLELVGLERGVRQVSFGRSGDIVGLSRIGRAVRWDGRTGRIAADLPAAGVGVLLGGGERVVVAHPDSGVQLSRVADDPAAIALGTLDELNPYCITATPDEDRVVVGGRSGRVSVWPVSGGAPLAWQAGKLTVTALAVSPDGEVLATASQTEPVTLWRIADGAHVADIPVEGRPVRSLAFSPDGRTLAAGGERGTLFLLDVGKGTIRRKLEGHNLLICGIAYSPDGTRLASASLDGTVRIWDSERGVNLLVLRGHRVHATCVAWSSDGRRLATGGGDHGEDACTVRVWEYPPEN